MKHKTKLYIKKNRPTEIETFAKIYYKPVKLSSKFYTNIVRLSV